MFWTVSHHTSSPGAPRYFEAAIFMTCHEMNMFGITFAYCILYVSSIFMYIHSSWSLRCSLRCSLRRFVASGCPAGLGRSVGGAPCRPCPEGTYSEEGEATSCDVLWLSDRPKWNAMECNGMQWNAVWKHMETVLSCIDLYRHWRCFNDAYMMLIHAETCNGVQLPLTGLLTTVSQFDCLRLEFIGYIYIQLHI